MSISKRKRFEVFKRDKFTCQYCGNYPPDVVLECDHIHPRCEGGSDEYENLITSCFDCNRGKSGNLLEESDAEAVMAMKLETLAQVTAFNQMLRESIEAREDQFEWLYGKVADALDYAALTTPHRHSVKAFSKRLNFEEIIEAAEVACSKMFSSTSQEWRYFCGICWSKIRTKEEANA